VRALVSTGRNEAIDNVGGRADLGIPAPQVDDRSRGGRGDDAREERHEVLLRKLLEPSRA
jgi:hypothetical protein